MNAKPTYQELEQELKEIKAKNFYKTSLNFEQQLLVEIAANGNVIKVNQKTCEVLGYSEHEIIGKNWFDNFLPKKIKATIIPISQKLLKGEIEENRSVENTVLTKSGKERLIHWHNAIEEDKAGNIIGHLSTGEDITEQKQTENKLKQALAIIERSPSIVFLWKNEENWPVAYVSNNVEKLFGYTAQDFLSGAINYRQLIHPADIETVANEVKTYSNNNTKSFSHKPYRIITKKGTIKWVKDHTYIKRNNKGAILEYEGTILDITERIIANQTLEKLEVAIKHSLHEIFIFDATTLKFTFANATAINNLGYTFEELLKKSPLDLTPTYTKEKALKKLAPIVNGEVNSIHFEAIHQRKDNTTYPIEVHLNTFNSEGKDQFLAIINDITHKKTIENQLIESEHRFRAFTNQATEGISVSDLKGNYTFVNPAFCKLVGYTEKELLKMTVFEVTADKNDTNTFKKSISTYEEKPVMVELIRKNGTTFIAEVLGKNITIDSKKRVLGIVRDVTESINQERLLIARKEFLKEAQKIAKLGTYTLDIESGVWTSSPMLDTLLGIDKKYKKDIESWLAIVHPKERLQLQEYLSKHILEDHQLFDKEYRIKRMNDGEVRFVHGHGKLQFNKAGKLIRMIGTIQDITERKEAELKLIKTKNQLKTKEREFRNLFNNSPVSLWEEDIAEVLQLLNKKKNEVANLKNYLDEHPAFVQKCASKIKVLHVNPVTLKLLGVENKEELIKNLSGSFNAASFETLKEELVAFANNELEYNGETEFVRQDGNVITVVIKVVKFSKTRIVVSMSDITTLKNAVEKATENNRLKTEFISNMSHEIRTPLNGILGFSDFLDDPEVSLEKRINFVKIIKNSGYQLLKIIDDILEISKLETKQVKTYEEPFNLNDLLIELFSIFDTKAKENKTPLYLKNTLKNDQSAIVSDKFKLYKILSNLIENALKFTNTGYIEFGYVIKNEKEQAILELYVKDTGKGIDKEHQELIFERFVQTEIDPTKRKKGLGLGLSIAKENTELIGGNISVVSTKGKGTTFFVSIPYKPVVINDETKIDTSKQLSILIVEDEEVNYFYLTTLIEVILKIDCTFIHAKNGLEAVEICEKNPKIDLVLMDLKMPIMDGYTATKKIKELNPTIPILVQTAYSTQKEIEKATAAGCNEFISKPITKDRLLEKLKILVPSL